MNIFIILNITDFARSLPFVACVRLVRGEVTEISDQNLQDNKCALRMEPAFETEVIESKYEVGSQGLRIVDKKQDTEEEHASVNGDEVFILECDMHVCDPLPADTRIFECFDCHKIATSKCSLFVEFPELSVFTVIQPKVN